MRKYSLYKVEYSVFVETQRDYFNHKYGKEEIFSNSYRLDYYNYYKVGDTDQIIDKDDDYIISVKEFIKKELKDEIENEDFYKETLEYGYEEDDTLYIAVGMYY